MIVHNSEPSRRHQGARPSRKWRVEPLPKEVCAGAGRESFPGAGEIGAGITLTQPPLVDRAERSGKRARRGVGEAAVGPCGRVADRVIVPPPLVWVCVCVCEMGKEQELLEAARTGNLPAVEKLLSGKRQSAGSAAASGAGSSGNTGSGGHSSSHTLSSLLRWEKTTEAQR